MNVERKRFTTPAPISMSKSSAAFPRVTVSPVRPWRMISWMAENGVLQM
jgi:hypothetical protein